MCIVAFWTVDRADRGFRIIELADAKLANNAQMFSTVKAVVVMCMAARQLDAVHCPALVQGPLGGSAVRSLDASGDRSFDTKANVKRLR